MRVGIKGRALSVGLAFGLAAPSTLAQPLTLDTTHRVYGMYAVACDKAGGPRVYLSAQSIEVEVGNERLRAKNPEEQLSYFGKSPPAGAENALMGLIRPDVGLVVVVYRDRIGQYVEIEGHPEVEAALGKALLKQKFRRCMSAPASAGGGTPNATTAPATSAPAVASATPAADPCGGAGSCYAAPTFVAEVVRVTPSRPSAGPVNATVVQRIEVRFRNISAKPIILAHPPDTAAITDNRGNRYRYWNARVNVAGIGLMGNNAVDPTFTIRPNESRNAIFELRFVYDSRQIVPGTTLTFDLEVQEIEAAAAQQFRTVRRDAVAFRDLSSGGGSAGREAVPSGTAAPSVGASSPFPASAAPGPASDPCGGASACYSAETFVAAVIRVTSSRPSAGPVNATVVQRVDVRFRNISTKPIILAHPPDTAAITDNRGNRYRYWNAKVNVAGIGLMWNNAVDPSFVIHPGESRNATFEQRFVYDARQSVPGDSFTFDLEVREIEPASGQQFRTVRRNAVAFRGLSG